MSCDTTSAACQSLDITELLAYKTNKKMKMAVDGIISTKENDLNQLPKKLIKLLPNEYYKNTSYMNPKQTNVSTETRMKYFILKLNKLWESTSSNEELICKINCCKRDKKHKESRIEGEKGAIDERIQCVTVSLRQMSCLKISHLTFLQNAVSYAVEILRKISHLDEIGIVNTSSKIRLDKEGSGKETHNTKQGLGKTQIDTQFLHTAVYFKQDEHNTKGLHYYINYEDGEMAEKGHISQIYINKRNSNRNKDKELARAVGCVSGAREGSDWGGTCCCPP